MGDNLPPSIPPGDNRSGVEIHPPARVKEGALFVIPSPLLWATAAVFTLLSAWLAIKLWSCGHELTALRTSSEVEHAASRVLRNELDAERLISARLAQDFRRLEESSKASSSMAGLIPGTQTLDDLRILRLQPAPGIERPGMAFVVWNTRSQTGLALIGELHSLSPDSNYRLGIAEATGASWLDAGALAVDSSTGTGRLLFVHAMPAPESARFAILRSSGNADGQADPEVILTSP